MAKTRASQKQTGGEIFLRHAVRDEFRHVSVVVLDIDGVILDVRGSFRVAISRTTQFYLTQIAGFTGEATAVSPEDTQLFKMAGGFNNDWDLTYAVVLLYLSKAAQHGSRSLDVLVQRPPLLQQFADDIARRGGGLTAAEAAAMGGLTRSARRELAKAWDRQLIKQIFQEHYAGEDYCERLYGFSPKFIRGKGLLSKEKVLLDGVSLQTFLPNVGILTGRTPEETEIALERSGLVGVINPRMIVADTGSGPTKPNPAVLARVVEGVDSKTGLYVGDTPDDLRTVQNARAKGLHWLAGIVLARADERDYYLAHNVDILAQDVNVLLEQVATLREAR